MITQQQIADIVNATIEYTNSRTAGIVAYETEAYNTMHFIIPKSTCKNPEEKMEKFVMTVKEQLYPHVDDTVPAVPYNFVGAQTSGFLAACLEHMAYYYWSMSHSKNEEETEDYTMLNDRVKTILHDMLEDIQVKHIYDHDLMDLDLYRAIAKISTGADNVSFIKILHILSDNQRAYEALKDAL